jgi:D-amino-acid dehydrogenase
MALPTLSAPYAQLIPDRFVHQLAGHIENSGVQLVTSAEVLGFEMAGFDMSINNRRLQAILKSMPAYFPDFDVSSLELVEIWRGLRPCSPDGLPYIGRPRRYDYLIVATGHGMKGISLVPVTGKLVAQLAAHEQPQIDLTYLSINRFGPK